MIPLLGRLKISVWYSTILQLAQLSINTNNSAIMYKSNKGNNTLEGIVIHKFIRGSLSGNHGYRFRIGGGGRHLKLGEEKRARIIVGHVRPDHIDEVSEHCDIAKLVLL